ncbi:hypothetical protein GEV33_005338 [Tenebrio molitor]|jgi:hypothetical protein|uniref:Uncharacterized protein n=1 Tax=Tenebrio molitor TaxID=7067 RepID=A0A8J6HNI5_TENMO|nr:hypothetical protein GEV33_005338 [Tenebrio molitor]
MARRRDRESVGIPAGAGGESLGGRSPMTLQTDCRCFVIDQAAPILHNTSTLMSSDRRGPPSDLIGCVPQLF